MTKKVGEFELDDKKNLWGPAEYLKDQGDKFIKEIMSGKSVVFSAGLIYSPDAETALLVALQTDYARYLGMKQVEGWIKSHEPKPEPTGYTCGGNPATHCSACTREAMER